MLKIHRTEERLQKPGVLHYAHNFYMNPTKDEPVSTVAEKEEKEGRPSVLSVCCAGCVRKDEQVKKTKECTLYKEEKET